jgi:hypothetical protein
MLAFLAVQGPKLPNAITAPVQLHASQLSTQPAPDCQPTSVSLSPDFHHNILLVALMGDLGTVLVKSTGPVSDLAAGHH